MNAGESEQSKRYSLTCMPYIFKEFTMTNNKQKKKSGIEDKQMHFRSEKQVNLIVGTTGH